MAVADKQIFAALQAWEDEIAAWRKTEIRPGDWMIEDLSRRSTLDRLAEEIPEQATFTREFYGTEELCNQRVKFFAMQKALETLK